MAYNTKTLLTDAGTKQIPQFFDTAADNYYALLGTNGLGPFYVSRGAAAHDAAAAGNPVQVGGVYRTADPALANGDVGSLRVNAKGELITATQLTGSTVVIGATTYQLTDGAVLRGTNAIKPTAALAHAAIPYCYYFAIDTGVVEATDGTNWVVI